MNIFAQKSTMDSIQNLYHNRDNDEDADWTIVSQGGDQFKVHPWIIKMRSEVLKRGMTSMFTEHAKKTIELKMCSTFAVKAFLKFLYGFELDFGLDLEILKEVLVLSDMYDVKSLREAVAHVMKKVFTKDNVLEILDLLKQHRVENIDGCLKFIVENFKSCHLKEEKILKKHPEIAMNAYLENGDKDRQYLGGKLFSVFKTDPDATMKFSWHKSFRSELSFHIENAIFITGVGFYLDPGSEVHVELTFQRSAMYVDPVRKQTITQKLKNTTNGRIVKMTDIHAPFSIGGHNGMSKITASIKGDGSAPVVPGYAKETVCIMDGTDENGEFVKQVTFTFKPGENHNIAEFYFQVPKILT